MTDKSYFEIEFAVLFLDQAHELTPTGFRNPATRYYKANPDVIIIPVAALEPGEALQAIADHLFAEVNIPHHTDDTVYCFICHLFGIPNSQPAIMEMIALQKLAPQIYADFGALAKRADQFGPPVFDTPLDAEINDTIGDWLAGEAESDNAPLDLGPCCICETTTGVRNIITLSHPSPTPGQGWGCIQCNLPPDGAIAVLCDACLEKWQAGEPLRFICTGYAVGNGRTPYGEMSQAHFDHDMSQHPEEFTYD